MSSTYSACVRPPLSSFRTLPEVSTFTLNGNISGITQLNVWFTRFAWSAGQEPVYFEKQPSISVDKGVFTISLEVDCVYTLTTLNSGFKPNPANPSNPSLFPKAYVNNFDTCKPSSEADYFSDQNGIFQCTDAGYSSNRGIVMVRIHFFLSLLIFAVSVSSN